MALNLFQIAKGNRKKELHFKFKLLEHMKNEQDILLDWIDGFVDRDNKIITQFQETFHSSFWEFYLYACFKEADFKLDQSYNRPDFIIKSPFKFYVEAVVSNIKENGRKEFDRNLNDLMDMFIPPNEQPDFNEVLDEAIVRHSSALRSKLNKYQEYSKCDWIDVDVPFVLGMSSYDQVNYGREYIYPMMALLYGQYYVPEERGYIEKEYIIKSDTGADIEIGLFNSDENSNISAVIYSCTTTIGKLTSLALSSGKNSNNVVYNIRRDYEDNDIPYKLQVVDNKSQELLTDGLFVFHNPNAKNKLDIACFEKTNITQFFLEDGEIKHTSNPYPIIARLSINKFLQPGFEILIQEYLRRYNNVSLNDFYNNSQIEKINFENMCSVCIIAKISDNQSVIFHYERSKINF